MFFFKAVIFKYTHLEHISHSMALDMGRKNKNTEMCKCVCAFMCVVGSASVSQGHVVRCMVMVSRSGSPGLGARLMRRIFHLCPPDFCVFVYRRVWPCVCVRVGGCARACVLNSTEQVVRYPPNTVARQMADPATCIPFRPPGQTPASPH